MKTCFIPHIFYWFFLSFSIDFWSKIRLILSICSLYFFSVDFFKNQSKSIDFFQKINLEWKNQSRLIFFNLGAFGSGPRPSVFNTFDLKMCFAPQRRALFRHRNLQKWSEPLVFCTFWLGNVLRATTACTFSTSQLPKVVRSCGVLYILTWKCASRHNGVHFFDISTSKSGPTLRCFVHFDLEMCFAPQRRALFRRRHFQKWSENGVFCTFSLGNVLRATTACNFSSLLWPAGSAPAALASLLFDPPEPQIIGKTQCFATFLPFRASVSSVLLLFLFSDLLSSNLSLLSASALLCFSSVHIVGSLTSKLPSTIWGLHKWGYPHVSWNIQKYHGSFPISPWLRKLHIVIITIIPSHWRYELGPHLHLLGMWCQDFIGPVDPGISPTINTKHSNGWWYTYPSEKWWTSSVGMMKFPIYGKILQMFQTTNQIRWICHEWASIIFDHPLKNTYLRISYISIGRKTHINVLLWYNSSTLCIHSLK